MREFCAAGNWKVRRGHRSGKSGRQTGFGSLPLITNGKVSFRQKKPILAHACVHNAINEGRERIETKKATDRGKIPMSIPISRFFFHEIEIDLRCFHPEYIKVTPS